MSAGSLRKVTIDGLPYNVAADANVALNARLEKESIPHSGGNMTKRTLGAAMAEAVKLIVTPSEYDVLESQSVGTGAIPLAYEMADGSTFRTQGQINLGPYQTDDSSCEVQFLTSTGDWQIFSET